MFTPSPQVRIVLLAALMAAAAAAQHPAAAGTSAAGYRQRGLGSGLPPIAPIPGLGMQAQPRRFLPRTALSHAERRFAYPLLPFGYPAGSQPSYYYAPQVNVIVLPAAAQAAPVPAAEPPAGPVNSRMEEYDWPTAPAAAPPVSQRHFLLVLRDGSVRTASAIWFQADQLHYVDESGAHRALPPGSLDREATMRDNRENGLRVFLPQ